MCRVKALVARHYLHVRRSCGNGARGCRGVHRRHGERSCPGRRRGRVSPRPMAGNPDVPVRRGTNRSHRYRPGGWDGRLPGRGVRDGPGHVPRLAVARRSGEYAI